MDMWKYFDIIHRHHVLCNPMKSWQLDQLIDLLLLEPGSRVLDMATGKGEFIIRLAERYDIEGVGVDLSPFCVTDARKKHQDRVPDARLSFLEMDGAEYAPEQKESFDLAACLGASWIYGGHRGTLVALKEMTVPGGWVVVGEPYWRQAPLQPYLEAIGQAESDFGTHFENADIGRALELELVFALVSSQEAWDDYEGLHWYATDRWAQEHPTDPDVAEVLRRVDENRTAYLRWGRETLGWAVYVFRKRS